MLSDSTESLTREHLRRTSRLIDTPINVDEGKVTLFDSRGITDVLSAVSTSTQHRSNDNLYNMIDYYTLCCIKCGYLVLLNTRMLTDGLRLSSNQ